jgi:hypothetical protein
MTWIIVAITGLAVAILLVFLVDERGARDTAFNRATQRVRPRADDQPKSLVDAHRLVVNAGTAGGLHFRVRPALIELTDARLRRGHGVDLTHPTAGTIVGEPLWSIVRPDARAPHDRMAAGLDPATFRAALDRLEEL